MTTSRVLLIAILALGLVACSRSNTDSVAHEPGQADPKSARESRQDGESAAKKAGKTAHEIAEETEKAAKKVGRALEKAGKEAREGWKEAEREDKAKGKQ
jgi:hypothetical protein